MVEILMTGDNGSPVSEIFCIATYSTMNLVRISLGLNPELRGTQPPTDHYNYDTTAASCLL